MNDDAKSDPPPDSQGLDRRNFDRFEVTWSVDCETEETFLYASIANISEMGIFVRTDRPLSVGTCLVLRFASPSSSEAFVLSGVVQWVNPVKALGDNLNPGMGIHFDNLSPDDRERIVEAVRTIAYVRPEDN